MSPLAAELADTLRQIGPATVRELREDYERRARLDLVAKADRIALDAAWFEVVRRGRAKLVGGAWEWVPERAKAAQEVKQRRLFG